MTYLYGHQSEDIRAMQKALIALGFDCGPDGADGGFGDDTLKAVKDAQAHFGLDETGVVTTELLIDLGVVKPKPPSIFSQLSSFLSLYNLFSKGTTMTADQLTGVVRAILGLISGYFIAKGIGSADVWTWIIAGVTGVIPFIWSWLSNRPKTIVPLSQK